jgi:hypothetical protein
MACSRAKFIFTCIYYTKTQRSIYLKDGILKYEKHEKNCSHIDIDVPVVKNIEISCNKSQKCMQLTHGIKEQWKM